MYPSAALNTNFINVWHSSYSLTCNGADWRRRAYVRHTEIPTKSESMCSNGARKMKMHLDLDVAMQNWWLTNGWELASMPKMPNEALKVVTRAQQLLPYELVGKFCVSACAATYWPVRWVSVSIWLVAILISLCGAGIDAARFGQLCNYTLA